MTSIEIWTTVSAVATVSYTVVTLITLIFISRQVADTRRFSQAQFINELEKEFSSYSDVFEVLRQPDQQTVLTDIRSNKRGKFFACLDFFERVKTLLDTKAVTLTIVDRILGQPFFLVVNNPQVQEAILLRHDGRFPELFALHKQLIEYRQKRGRVIPNNQTDLANSDAIIYQTNLEIYQQMK